MTVSAHTTGTADRYFDLLKRVLVREPALPADHEHRELFEDGRAHHPDAETLIGLRRLDSLERCIRTVLADEVPGDLIECGVWRGGASIFMRAALDALGDTDRRVWLADSFEGLPGPDGDVFPDDRNLGWMAGQWAVPLEEVKANFRRYGLLDERVEFLPGFFRDTLPTAPVERLAVLRADGDLYESTFLVLEALYDRVAPGGFVIIDDYHCFEQARLATDDFRRDHGIDEPLERTDWTEVLWRKRA